MSKNEKVLFHGKFLRKRMAKQNSADKDYTDGCIYEFSTYLQPGNYNYSFGCFDGDYYNTTTTQFDPVVSITNEAGPTLQNGA